MSLEKQYSYSEQERQDYKTARLLRFAGYGFLAAAGTKLLGEAIDLVVQRDQFKLPVLDVLNASFAFYWSKQTDPSEQWEYRALLEKRQEDDRLFSH